MTAGMYSFIDICVLDEIRGHLAAGDPLVLFTGDLSTVLWANGPGAAFLDSTDVEAVMGMPAELGRAAVRQIGALRGFPEIGRDIQVTIRVHAGFNSSSLDCRASRVRLPDGEAGILLALPGTVSQGERDADIAARTISGIGNDGRYAALIDGSGKVLAETEGYARLEVADDTIAELIRDVRDERDRLVKRMISSARGEIAAGIGRLSEEPPLHLLVLVAEDPEPIALDAALSERSQPATPAPTPEAMTRLAETPLPGGAIPASPAESREAPPALGGAPAEAVLPGPDSAPLRFSWRTDPSGRVSAFSESFGEVFGKAAAALTGRRFAEIAEVFGIDRDGEIAGLLERRDTWSGRTVHWPVEGTDRMIPVDLAALPAYDRERKFQGFRGFGVARLNEIMPDPEARGMKPPLAATSAEEERGETPPPIRVRPAPTEAPRSDVPGHDPFRGEVPAIRPAGQPEVEGSGKVVRLAEHRNGAHRALSDSERSALQEIAERLRRETAVRAEVADADTDARHPPAAPAPPPETTVAERRIAAREPEAPATDERPPIAVEIARSGFVPSAFATQGSDTEKGLRILDQLPVAVLIRSADALHYANPEFFRLTGFGSLEDLARAGGFERLFARSGDFGEERSAARHAILLRTRDGVERPCEALLKTVDWASRKALMFAIRPVEESAADARLKERVEELTAILDTATDGVVLIRPDGSIRSVNRSAEALFGFESEELVGKPFTTLFAVESQRSAADYLAGLTDNGVASVLNDGREVIGREAKGRFIPLFMTIGRLPGSGGFCAVMRDITPWKRAEEELIQARGMAERASSQKTGFLARISHEIRTPLNAIIGFSELMMDERFGPIGNERYRDYLRDINRSGNHVLDLVNDLLDISKIEAGEQELSFEAVSLNDCLADAVAMMQPEANRERVIIRSSFASRLPDVVADKRSIKQIALNLLSNAIRFTPAGGQVIVSTALETGGDVVLRVRDTGIGMSKVEIEQALKPFRQITRLNHRPTGGTGLGLPLTKAMVEANRARFSIDSVPDEGTIVEITFPSTRVLAD